MRVARKLAQLYPDAECALVHESPLELLIATILSAQCTDARVNIVTKELFQKYRSAEDFARAPLPQLEKGVKTTGFFRNKAKNIKACCQQLVDKHGGEVPRDMESLVVLPGVGRKTANVVLGTAFGIPSGVVVDTHVSRLSNRMGLTESKDPIKIEQDLMRELPAKEWIAFSHRMIQHGRRVCMARSPQCETCALADICPRIGVEERATSKKGAAKVPKPGGEKQKKAVAKGGTKVASAPKFTAKTKKAGRQPRKAVKAM
ncbi:MAG TPA: endonuclease III [Pirellulales bacterium]|nr:endonuclease III [Pirellulales bacterium]